MTRPARRQDDAANRRAPRWPALVAAAVTFVVFSRALTCGFVDWDDGVLLLDNPDYRGLGWANLRWMFTTTLMGNYQPVTWLSYGLDYLLYGMDPRGYHLTSISLHALNAGLLYLVALRLYRAAGAAATAGGTAAAGLFAALLFGVHPLRAESVAWVTERKDVLSLFFLLVSLLMYLRHVEQPGTRRWYAMSLAVLALSLLSKPWGMTWFAVLLVLDWYPLRRLGAGAAEKQTEPRAPALHVRGADVTGSASGFGGAQNPLPHGRGSDGNRRPWVGAGRRVVLEKVPIVLLCAAAGGTALYVQTTQVISTARLDLFGRLAQACYGLVFYVWKSILPLALTPIYEHPRPMDPFAPRYVACAALVVAAGAALWSARRRRPGGLAAGLIYVLSIAPVLGLVQVGPQFVAERYSYVACIPWALLAGVGIVIRPARGRRWIVAASVGVVATLAGLTWRQIGFWRDVPTLWTRALACDPESFNAHANLGAWHYRRGTPDAALTHLRRAYEAVPKHVPAVLNLASCLGQMGRRKESLALFRRAAGLDPPNPVDWLTIGNGLMILGQPQEAQDALRRALGRAPDLADAHFRLALLLEREGDADAALGHYRRAADLTEPAVRSGQSDPAVFIDAEVFAQSCVRAAALLEQRGETREAAQYRRRLRLSGHWGTR